MKAILVFIAVFMPYTLGEKVCGVAQWEWPTDFKLLTSKDPIEEFVGYNCWTYRDMTTLHNGKYFCWVKKETLPPIRFRGIWEDDHGEKCTPMLEPIDITYKIKGFCTSFELAAKFKVNWHFNSIFGFDAEKCIKFNRLHLIGDSWMLNYLCGEKIVFEQKYCDDDDDNNQV